MRESSLFGKAYTDQRQFTPATGFLLLCALSWLLFLGLLISILTQQFGWFLGITLLILSWDTIVSTGILLIAWRQLTCSQQAISQQAISPQTGSASATPTMTVIIPAWNEADALPRTLNSLLAQSDQPETIIVADDGSTDGSLDRLAAEYGLEFINGDSLGRSRRYPHLYALRKPHSGKADSLNQAIVRSKDEVVIVLDADTSLYPGAIAAVRESFAQHPHLHAVAGVPVPSCSKSWHGQVLQFFQRYEYMRGYVWHVGWNAFDAVVIISGACSAFRRDLLLAVEGYDASNWTEDCEIIFRLQAYLRSRGEGFRVRIDPRFLARTDAPDTLISFLRQRRRWFGGFWETLVQYRHLVGNRRYGWFGLGNLAQAALTVMGPFNILLGTIGGLVFYTQGYLLPLQLWLLGMLIGVYNLLVSYGRLALYQAQIKRYYLSGWAMLLESLIAPLVYQPMVTIAQLWGYYSCLKRQKSW